MLRENGASEYWCNKIFNPNDDFPGCVVVIPVDNASLVCKLDDMYNDYEEDHLVFAVNALDKTSKYFEDAISGLERRCI